MILSVFSSLCFEAHVLVSTRKSKSSRIHATATTECVNVLYLSVLNKLYVLKVLRLVALPMLTVSPRNANMYTQHRLITDVQHRFREDAQDRINHRGHHPVPLR